MLPFAAAANASSPRKRPTKSVLSEPLADCSAEEASAGQREQQQRPADRAGQQVAVRAVSHARAAPASGRRTRRRADLRRTGQTTISST